MGGPSLEPWNYEAHVANCHGRNPAALPTSQRVEFSTVFQRVSFWIALDKGHQKYIVCGLLGLSLCKNRAHVGPNLSFTTCLHAFHHRSPMLHGPLPG